MNFPGPTRRLKATSPIRLLLKRKCRDNPDFPIMRVTYHDATKHPKPSKRTRSCPPPGIVFNGELGYAEGSAKSHFGNV